MNNTKTVYAHVNLAGNELRKYRAQAHDVHPEVGRPGEVYFNRLEDRLYMWNFGEWQRIILLDEQNDEINATNIVVPDVINDPDIAQAWAILDSHGLIVGPDSTDQSSSGHYTDTHWIIGPSTEGASIQADLSGFYFGPTIEDPENPKEMFLDTDRLQIGSKVADPDLVLDLEGAEERRYVITPTGETFRRDFFWGGFEKAANTPLFRYMGAIPSHTAVYRVEFAENTAEGPVGVSATLMSTQGGFSIISQTCKKRQLICEPQSVSLKDLGTPEVRDINGVLITPEILPVFVPVSANSVLRVEVVSQDWDPKLEV